MATVTLQLKDSNAKKTAIRAVISDGRNFNMKIYSGISVNPKHWSKKGKYVLSADPNASVLNTALMEIKKRLLEAYLKAKFEGVLVTSDYLKEQVWPAPKKELSFWNVWDIFLESKSGEFKPHSFAKFRALANHLRAFEDFMNRPLILSSIDQILLEDLQRYCYSEKKLNTQSTSKYIGLLKIFLNWCLKRKYTDNTDFQFFKAAKQPDSLKVILTKDDIEALEKLDVGEKQYLHNVRELLVLSCETGLRYSDYSRIQKQHLKTDQDGTSILQIRQQKTSEIIEIPLTPRGIQIIDQLVNGGIHPISNQKMNKYVKELCQLAGLDESFEVFNFIGKEQTVELKPKYELITTHTGRRTFATNLLQRGVPAEIVMQFTGHRDYKSFSKYVNIPKTSQKKVVKDAMIESYMRVIA